MPISAIRNLLLQQEMENTPKIVDNCSQVINWTLS